MGVYIYSFIIVLTPSTEIYLSKSKQREAYSPR